MKIYKFRQFPNHIFAYFDGLMALFMKELFKKGILQDPKHEAEIIKLFDTYPIQTKALSVTATVPMSAPTEPETCATALP